MAEGNQRAGALAWSLLACPLIALLVGWAASRSDLGAVTVVGIFIGVSGVLSLVGQAVMRRPVAETFVLSLLSAAEGGLAWLLLVIWLASQGVFDT